MPIAQKNAQASSSRLPLRNGRGNTDPIDDGSDSDDQRVRAPRGKLNGRAAVRVDEAEEEDGWTVETFHDRPIEKDNVVLHMIKSLTDNLKEVIRKVEEGMTRATDTAKAIEDASADDDAIEDVEAGLLRAIDQRQVVQIKVDVLEGMHMKLRQGEALVDADAYFKRESTRRTAEYMTKTQRAKFKDAKEYVEFRTSIWEIHHPNEACPPMSRWLPRSEEDASDDDDFEMGGTTQNYRCPITLLPYKDAVTNSACGHSYSRGGIDGIFDNAKKSKRSARCPVAGCNVEISKENVKSDKALQKRTDEFEKRRARREEESDDDDDHVDISQDT